MKNKKKKIALMLALALASGAFAGCSLDSPLQYEDAYTITGVSSYDDEDEFSIEGTKLKLKVKDKEEYKEFVLSDDMLKNKPDMNSTEEQTVTFVYEGKEYSFKITINPSRSTIEKNELLAKLSNYLKNGDFSEIEKFIATADLNLSTKFMGKSADFNPTYSAEINPEKIEDFLDSEINADIISKLYSLIGESLLETGLSVSKNDIINANDNVSKILIKDLVLDTIQKIVDNKESIVKEFITSNTGKSYDDSINSFALEIAELLGINETGNIEFVPLFKEFISKIISNDQFTYEDYISFFEDVLEIGKTEQKCSYYLIFQSVATIYENAKANGVKTKVSDAVAEFLKLSNVEILDDEFNAVTSEQALLKQEEFNASIVDLFKALENVYFNGAKVSEMFQDMTAAFEMAQASVEYFEDNGYQYLSGLNSYLFEDISKITSLLNRLSLVVESNEINNNLFKEMLKDNSIREEICAFITDNICELLDFTLANDEIALDLSSSLLEYANSGLFSEFNYFENIINAYTADQSGELLTRFNEDQEVKDAYVLLISNYAKLIDQAICGSSDENLLDKTVQFAKDYAQYASTAGGAIILSLFGEYGFDLTGLVNALIIDKTYGQVTTSFINCRICDLMDMRYGVEYCQNNIDIIDTEFTSKIINSLKVTDLETSEVALDINKLDLSFVVESYYNMLDALEVDYNSELNNFITSVLDTSEFDSEKSFEDNMVANLKEYLTTNKSKLVNMLIDNSFTEFEDENERADVKEDAKEILDMIIDGFTNNDLDFNALYTKSGEFCNKYYGDTRIQTAFFAVTTFIIVMIAPSVDIDFNELFKTIQLPEGVEIDYNKFVNKMYSMQTWENCVTISDLTCVINENGAKNQVISETYKFTINVNFDAEIAKVIGDVKLSLTIIPKK